MTPDELLAWMAQLRVITGGGWIEFQNVPDVQGLPGRTGLDVTVRWHTGGLRHTIRYALTQRILEACPDCLGDVLRRLLEEVQVVIDKDASPVAACCSVWVKDGMTRWASPRFGAGDAET